jgi:hypothetical protein
MKWITRKDVKVDRVACPWLIKRFVDPHAEFLFVEEKDLLDESRRQGAIPFDAPRIEAIKLNHRGPRGCPFPCPSIEFIAGLQLDQSVS